MPESFERRCKELETALTIVQKKLRDREAAAKTWRDDVLDGVKFLEGVRECFNTGKADTRLDILRRLGQTLELKDKALTFELAEPFDEGRREKRLEILHRLNQTIQLRDGVLDFRMKPTFSELSKSLFENSSQRMS
jgi:DNA-binding transcriptional ArsR family regulator